MALNRIARVWQRPAPACQGEDTTFSSDDDDDNDNVDNANVDNANVDNDKVDNDDQLKSVGRSTCAAPACTSAPALSENFISFQSSDQLSQRRPQLQNYFQETIQI